MRLCITGATGLLGSNLAILAHEAGHEVVSTKRSSSVTAHLSDYPIDWTLAALSDVSALTKAFEGCDVVFHCAAAVSVRYEVQPWIYEANVEGTRNVIEAFEKADAGRLIHCSTVAALGLSIDGEPSDETCPFNMAEFGLDDAYVKTKRESQEIALRAAAKGLDVVVVNPTYLIGPYDQRPSSGELVLKVAQRKVPGYTLGRNNFADVRDVARGMLLAAEHGRAGEMYILGGHNMTYKRFTDLVADRAGVPRLDSRIGPRAASFVGRLGDAYSKLTRREPLLNSATVRWAQTPRFVFRSDKAERELGYRTSPIEPAIEAALAWFESNGMWNG